MTFYQIYSYTYSLLFVNKNVSLGFINTYTYIYIYIKQSEFTSKKLSQNCYEYEYMTE